MGLLLCAYHNRTGAALDLEPAVVSPTVSPAWLTLLHAIATDAYVYFTIGKFH